MEVVIGWLPVIGGGIFWAIAISAWFSPDKQIAAVWFAFAGTVFFLLTVALQGHLYVATFVVQPKIEMEKPAAISHFRWEENNFPVVRAPSDPSSLGQSTSPRFKLRNTSAILAADVSVEWTAPAIDAVNLSNSSAQFQKFVTDVKDDSFVLLVPLQNSPPPHTIRFTYNAQPRSVLSIPFLNRSVETYIPYEVFSRGLMLLFARLPTVPGHEQFEIEYRASVSWSIPDRGKAQQFSVIAHVRNTKQVGDSAFMDADIEFEVRPLVN